MAIPFSAEAYQAAKEKIDSRHAEDLAGLDRLASKLGFRRDSGPATSPPAPPSPPAPVQHTVAGALAAPTVAPAAQRQSSPPPLQSQRRGGMVARYGRNEVLAAIDKIPDETFTVNDVMTKLRARPSYRTTVSNVIEALVADKILSVVQRGRPGKASVFAR